MIAARARRSSSGLALVLFLALAAVPGGYPRSDLAPPLVIAQSAPGIGPGEAAAIVERSSGGQVLSVGAAQRNGRPVYQVKVLLPGGTVRVVRVDAATGRMLN
jgi:hypothetical protein